MSWFSPWATIDDVVSTLVDGVFLHNRNPNEGQLGVIKDSLIRFTISSSYESDIDLANTIIEINGVEAYNGGFASPFNGPESSVTSVLGLWSVDFVIDIATSSYFESQSMVTIEVQAHSDDGRSLHQTYSYVMEDTAQPRVEKASALDRNVVRVEFTDNVASVVASSVEVTFPWGAESLVIQDGSWVFEDLTYPYVSILGFTSFELAKGTYLTLKIDGVEHTITIPSNETTSLGVATALNIALTGLGATSWVKGSYVYLRSDDEKGSIEIVSGGAQEALHFEEGEQVPRVAYYTNPATYNLPVKVIGMNGLVSYISIEYKLEGYSFVLKNFEETFDSSVLDPANYILTYDSVRVQSDINPTFLPPIARIEQLDNTSVLVYTARPLTMGGYYIITVENVLDTSGNVIDPDNNTATFDGFIPSEMAERAWDIYGLFPAFNRRQDESYALAFKKFCSVLQEVSLQALSNTDYIARWQDIAQAPEHIIDAKLETLGNPFKCTTLTEIKKKRLLGFLTTLYKEKGTEKGIRNAIKFILEIDPITFKYYWGTGWTLGVFGRSELGVSTVLNSGTLRDRYSFSIVVTTELTEEERTGIECIIRAMKPAHTHFISIIEPTAPFTPDHWMIPWSALGTTTKLH